MNDHVSACRHGQLSRVCRECELEAEIEALRAKVAGLEGGLERERMRLAACSTARAEAALEARDPTKSQIKRITAMADGRLEAAQSTIAELEATVMRLDKERIELAEMLLHYVRTVPLGNQPHMSAEIAEKMALVALGGGK